eukprot:scaffold162060_cov47-Attheya_sp.AAC.1
MSMWNSIMDDLVSRRKPHGIAFLGRCHDISTWCCSAVNQSLAMDYLDVPIVNEWRKISPKQRGETWCFRFWIALLTVPRHTCYGVVKCMRNLDYSVSPLFEIHSIEALKSLVMLLNCDFWTYSS